MLEPSVNFGQRSQNKVCPKNNSTKRSMSNIIMTKHVCPFVFVIWTYVGFSTIFHWKYGLVLFCHLQNANLTRKPKRVYLYHTKLRIYSLDKLLSDAACSKTPKLFCQTLLVFLSILLKAVYVVRMYVLAILQLGPYLLCLCMAYYNYTAWFFAFGIFVLTLPLRFLMRYTKRRHNLSNLIISQTLGQIEPPREIIQRGSKSHFLSNISILPSILLFKVLMLKDINKCYPCAKLRNFYPNRSRSIR